MRSWFTSNEAYSDTLNILRDPMKMIKGMGLNHGMPTFQKRNSQCIGVKHKILCGLNSTSVDAKMVLVDGGDNILLDGDEVPLQESEQPR